MLWNGVRWLYELDAKALLIVKYRSLAVTEKKSLINPPHSGSLYLQLGSLKREMLLSTNICLMCKKNMNLRHHTANMYMLTFMHMTQGTFHKGGGQFYETLKDQEAKEHSGIDIACLVL